MIGLIIFVLLCVAGLLLLCATTTHF